MYHDCGREQHAGRKAHQLKSGDQRFCVQSSADHDRFQFSLSTLFWLTGCVAIVCVITPPIWEMARHLLWPPRVQSIKEFLATRPRSSEQPNMDRLDATRPRGARERDDAEYSAYQKPLWGQGTQSEGKEGQQRKGEHEKLPCGSQ